MFYTFLILRGTSNILQELNEEIISRAKKVVVVKKRQLQLYAGQPLADVEMALRSIIEQDQNAPSSPWYDRYFIKSCKKCPWWSLEETATIPQLVVMVYGDTWRKFVVFHFHQSQKLELMERIAGHTSEEWFFVTESWSIFWKIFLVFKFQCPVSSQGKFVLEPLDTLSFRSLIGYCE